VPAIGQPRRLNKAAGAAAGGLALGAALRAPVRERWPGQSFLRVHWVAVPQTVRARRVNNNDNRARHELGYPAAAPVPPWWLASDAPAGAAPTPAELRQMERADAGACQLSGVCQLSEAGPLRGAYPCPSPYTHTPVHPLLSFGRRCAL
jgi:hypothetical protein